MKAKKPPVADESGGAARAVQRLARAIEEANYEKEAAKFKARIVQSLRARAGQGAQSPAGSNSAPDVECLVTLQQMAAMVSRSKHTLRKYLGKPDMPLPKVDRGRGRPAEWSWLEVRPWLETTFRRKLPKQFPADRLRPS